MGKFNKGLVLGGIIGAAFMWLNTTKKGKQKKEQLVTYASDIYDDIKKKALTSKEWKKMTKSAYVKMVLSAVDTYAKKYTLPASLKNMLTRLLLAQWERLKKEGKEYFS